MSLHKLKFYIGFRSYGTDSDFAWGLSGWETGSRFKALQCALIEDIAECRASTFSTDFFEE
jgi:hypothetical protein